MSAARPRCRPQRGARGRHPMLEEPRMAAWVACALVALVLLKPQEFIPALSGLPLVHLAFAGALAAAAIDIIRGRLRLALAPQVPYLVAFLGWALLVTAVKRPDALGEQVVGLAIVLGMFTAVAVGCGSA